MIPEIDVRGNIARKNFEGTIDVLFEADESLLEIPFVKFAGPVRAQLDWSILTDNATVEVDGNISFTLTGSCSRCLSPASSDILFAVDAVFVPGEGDGEAYGYTGGKVSFKEFLHDSILFALPSRLLCKACEQWEKD